jgi:hypothetical protein
VQEGHQGLQQALERAQGHGFGLRQQQAQRRR